MNSTISTETAYEAHRWVADTSFGRWFLSTDIWLRYVLTPAIDDLARLLGPQSAGIHCLMDIGCGQGMALPILADRFRPQRMLAVDIDPGLVNQAVAVARQQTCLVQTLTSSVLALDLPDRSVDAIFCHQLLHHVAQQERALRELYRVLAPGGILLVSESCESFINTWTVRWLFRHPPNVQRPARGFVQLVRQAGFMIDERQIREYAPWWSLRDFGLLRWLGLRTHAPEPTEVLLIARKQYLDAPAS
jgi:ubiquinone/menaquinone biosynthesis C-methylase UbiE